jgi:hypothetical protein
VLHHLHGRPPFRRRKEENRDFGRSCSRRRPQRLPSRRGFDKWGVCGYIIFLRRDLTNRDLSDILLVYHGLISLLPEAGSPVCRNDPGRSPVTCLARGHMPALSRNCETCIAARQARPPAAIFCRDCLRGEASLHRTGAGGLSCFGWKGGESPAASTRMSEVLLPPIAAVPFASICSRRESHAFRKLPRRT